MTNSRLSLTITLGFVILAPHIIALPISQLNHDIYWYNPEDIALEDNVYNVTDYFSLQWWYLDAVFDNNYSIHIGILTLGSRGTTGFFLFRIHIYQDGKLLIGKFKFVPVRCIDISQTEPLLMFNGEEILRGYTDDEERMALNVSLDIQGIKADLTYTALIRGWKGFTGHGMWGCPLPKAHVQGTLSLFGETVPVQGFGYQEHGWDIRHLHRSWYWGKFSNNQTNVIFSQNLKNRWEEDTFIVMVNTGENSYSSIVREHIDFYHTEYRFNHGRFIPVKSVFQVDQDDIHIDVEFKVQSIHFTSLMIMSHWRFHTKINGVVTIGNCTESVDDMQIMEIFHFP